MNNFEYRNDKLYAEDVLIDDIANTYGTPTFVYSRSTLERNFLAYADALQGDNNLVCYALKANSNLAVLDVLARLGAGFDIVSIGELQRVMQVGVDPAKVVFSGVGKTPHEMQQALELNVHCFNIESEAELNQLQTVAASLNKVAPVSLRVNPDVDAGTHPYISTGLKENKFGIGIDHAKQVYRQASQMSHIKILGIDCHIGSQLTQIDPYLDAIDRLISLIKQLDEEGITLQHLDIGGGLGITYADESIIPIQAFVQQIQTYIKTQLPHHDLGLILEPGRSISGNAGILVTQVEYLKTNTDKHFAIVDAAMNDLLRPSLYSAWHDIIPATISPQVPIRQYDIVGPICESGDFLGKERDLRIQSGDRLAVCNTGAYGFCMASNYNTRPRAAEVMVDGDQVHIIGQRETLTDLWQRERTLPTSVFK